MFLSHNSSEDKSARIERQIAELEASSSALSRDTAQFYDELEVPLDQILVALSDRSRFSDGSWERLEQERAKLQARLQARLDQVKGLRKSPNAIVRPHWLHVR